MPHALELKYGLTAQELLDAIDKRFRLKVALEGTFAEGFLEYPSGLKSKPYAMAQNPRLSCKRHAQPKLIPVAVTTTVITSMLWLFVLVAPLAIGVNSDTH